MIVTRWPEIINIEDIAVQNFLKFYKVYSSFKINYGTNIFMEQYCLEILFKDTTNDALKILN